MKRPKVVILQHRLLHYRTELFDDLRQACHERNIELHLVHGQATRREQGKRDTGTLPWAHSVRNWVLEIGDKDILWQSLPAVVHDADLVILMQENRLLSNYPILLSQFWRKRKVAYWGHGRNFQSQSTSGWRERWKSFLLCKVAWWFAYSSVTEDILINAGFPRDRITVLNNSIDSEGFKRDLAAVSDYQLAAMRAKLAIRSDSKVALFCGSLYPEKRLDLMVKAGDWIYERASDFRLIVLGDGPSRPELDSLAHSRPWLKPVGTQHGAAKAQYFKLAQIVFNPGMVGLHVVDAFCAGLVMATTNSAHHSPEIAYLKDGTNGVMTEADHVEYGRAILDLFNNFSKLNEMRRAALAASEIYTLENMVERFVIGIEGCLNSRVQQAGK